MGLLWQNYHQGLLSPLLRMQIEGLLSLPSRPAPSITPRDARILAARQMGVPLSQIARVHGISRQRVHQIIAKHRGVGE